MSARKDPENKNSEEPLETDTEKEPSTGERPKKIKKRKRKAQIISQAEIKFETDHDKLLYEITGLLKKARIAIAEKNYIEAITSYQDAAVTANMLGDPEREKIYLTRANEILQDHPELKAEGITLLKKRKLKTIIRKKEEKFSLTRLLTNMIFALLMIVLVYSGVFSAIILQELLEAGGSYNFTMLWGICIGIEVLGIFLAYLIGRYWLRWPE
ncbi:MAG: hypothetical protein ACTSQQ_03780 [Candidatus Helarchaeota archaeon]